MGYDRGDSFPFDFKPNGIPFGSENRKENCHLDHIPFNLKGNGIPTSFLSAGVQPSERLLPLEIINNIPQIPRTSLQT